jgi:hypothetical protein
LDNRALFIGRAFDCPDCGESLLIEADGSAGVKAKPSGTPTRRVSEENEPGNIAPSRTHPATRETNSRVSDRGVDLQAPKSTWDRLSRRPSLLGWIVAALFASLLLIVVNSGRPRTIPETNTPNVIENKTPTTAPQDSDNQSSKTVVENDQLEPKNNEPPDETKPKAASEPPPPDANQVPRPDKPIPAADSTETPAAEVSKPVPVSPPPEPIPELIGLSPAAIEAKLRQKIARFDQLKPVAFVKLLETVEELAGVPIVWDLDRVTDEQLQQSVTIRLKETTVGEILETLLKQVGLERRIVAGKIELQPRTEADPCF